MRWGDRVVVKVNVAHSNFRGGETVELVWTPTLEVRAAAGIVTVLATSEGVEEDYRWVQKMGYNSTGPEPSS